MTAGHAFVWAGGTRETIAVHPLPAVDGVARRLGRGGPGVLLLARLQVHEPNLNELVGPSRRQGPRAHSRQRQRSAEDASSFDLRPLRNEELNEVLELGFI